MTCPRCKTLRLFVALDGQALTRCAGCEWYFTFGTQAPTGTTNVAITAGTTTALSVASGGTSFISGMVLWCDAGLLTEVVTVAGTASATSIRCPAASSRTTRRYDLGQLLITPTVLTAERVPAAPGWGF